MAGYTIIADVGAWLVETLQKNMDLEIISNTDKIQLCNPFDRGDAQLGIYLYDLKESEEVRANGLFMEGIDKQKYPPIYLTLFYMITAYSISDIKFRSIQEQKILGKVVQVLRDNPIIHLEQEQLEMKIEMNPLELNDKMKIWNVPNTGYKLSLFYRITPVEIESLRKRKVTRVRHTEITIQE